MIIETLQQLLIGYKQFIYNVAPNILLLEMIIGTLTYIVEIFKSEFKSNMD